MKRILITIVWTLLTVSTNYLPISLAQDYTQWHLPEGVKARLGKGRISEIKYSPDGTKLAVAGSIGIGSTMPRQVKNLISSEGIRIVSLVLPLVRMAPPSQVGMGTERYCCGRAAQMVDCLPLKHVGRSFITIKG